MQFPLPAAICTFLMILSGFFPSFANAEAHMCGVIDRDAIEAKGSAYIFDHLRKHAKNPNALPLVRDALEQLEYELSSMRMWWKVQKILSNDQPDSIYIAFSHFETATYPVFGHIFHIYNIADNKLGIESDSNCDLYYMIESFRSNYWPLSWSKVNRARQFVAHTVDKQIKTHGEYEDLGRYFQPARDYSCSKEVAPGYILESGRPGASRIADELTLLCRMSRDSAALLRILTLVRDKERIAGSKRQESFIARTALHLSRQMLARIYANSYPLAVSERDPLFEGDPFAVFQAYQRQAEEAARLAQAVLDALPPSKTRGKERAARAPGDR